MGDIVFVAVWTLPRFVAAFEALGFTMEGVQPEPGLVRLWDDESYCGHGSALGALAVAGVVFSYQSEAGDETPAYVGASIDGKLHRALALGPQDVEGHACPVVRVGEDGVPYPGDLADVHAYQQARQRIWDRA